MIQYVKIFIMKLLANLIVRMIFLCQIQMLKIIDLPSDSLESNKIVFFDLDYNAKCNVMLFFISLWLSVRMFSLR